MNDFLILEKQLADFLSGYFWKIIWLIFSLYIINLIKDLVAKIITRNILISNQIANDDKIIKVGDYCGRVVKIGLTHIKIESEDGICHIPIEAIMKNQIVYIKKEKIYADEHIESHEEENKKNETGG